MTQNAFFNFILLASLVVAVSSRSSKWREAINENDNPPGLKNNTVLDRIEEANEEDNTDQRVKNVFEGDIQLTKDDSKDVDTSETNSADTADVEVDSVVTKRKAIRSRQNLWPTRVIPVELQSAASVAWNNILRAVSEIQSKSCIRFKMKEKGDKYWIRFVKNAGCYSPVGRQYLKPGVGQELSVGEGCNDQGIIMHELMHALGFWHEQARTDRDDYLEVLWENIADGQMHNFNRYKAAEMDFAGGVYDFSSIMHYGNYAFSKNGKPTMLSIKDPMLKFGQIAKLSDTDIMQLNAIYDCKETGKDVGWSHWGSWSPCDTKCSKERERFCFSSDISKCPGKSKDGIQVQTEKCENKECYAPVKGHWGRWGPYSKCSQTCGQGYKTRSRMCDDPRPIYGGKFCDGTLVQVMPCMEKETSPVSLETTPIIVPRNGRGEYAMYR